MQEAFKVLTTAKREAMQRLTQYAERGAPDELLMAMRHVISSLEDGYNVLQAELEHRNAIARGENNVSSFPILIKLARTGEERVCHDYFELPKSGYTILQTRYKPPAKRPALTKADTDGT